MSTTLRFDLTETLASRPLNFQLRIDSFSYMEDILIVQLSTFCINLCLSYLHTITSICLPVAAFVHQSLGCAKYIMNKK